MVVQNRLCVVRIPTHTHTHTHIWTRAGGSKTGTDRPQTVSVLNFVMPLRNVHALSTSMHHQRSCRHHRAPPRNQKAKLEGSIGSLTVGWMAMVCTGTPPMLATAFCRLTSSCWRRCSPLVNAPSMSPLVTRYTTSAPSLRACACERGRDPPKAKSLKSDTGAGTQSNHHPGGRASMHTVREWGFRV